MAWQIKFFADLIPNIEFFIKMYATKEATNSNRIEGARTTFDILDEKTGYNRNRYYVFEDYIKIFR